MYRVKIINNGYEITIQEPLSNSLSLLSGSLKKGINTFSSYEISMLKNNPGVGNIKPLKTLISVIDTLVNKEVFFGQVLQPTDYMNSDGTFGYEYLCAHFGSFLQDSIQDYYKAQNMMPEQFFRHLIGVHNAKVVESYKKFTVGIINVTNSTDNVYRYVDETATTWDTIMDKLVNRLGGEIQFRRENGINYIDYLTEAGEKKDTEIRLTRNMISFNRNIDPTSVVTVFKPRGARIKSANVEDYNAAEPRLTISSANDGKDYLLASQALIDEFGYREGSIAYDDINNASTLKTRGQQYLNAQKAALVKYNVAAADLSLLNLDPDRFDIGNKYMTINEVLGVHELLRITAMTIDTTNPQVSSLTIGDKTKSLSQYQNDLNKATSSLQNIEFNVANLQTNYQAINTELQEISQDVIDLNNAIVQGDLPAIQQAVVNLQSTVEDLEAAISSIPNYSLANSTNDGLLSSALYMKLVGIQMATQSIDGLMSSTDKTSLDKIVLDLGNKLLLQTTNKTDLVSAVNELHTRLSALE